MLCPNCKNEVPAAPFCSKCGSRLVDDSDSRPYGEVSGAWIKEILVASGYQVGDIDNSQADVESFVAKHSSNPNWWVHLRKSIRLLTFTSPWSIRTPGVLEQVGFFKAINAMNAGTVAAQSSVTGDLLNVQVPLFLTGKVTKLDIVAFNDIAITIVRRVIAEPSFQKYHAR